MTWPAAVRTRSLHRPTESCTERLTQRGIVMIAYPRLVSCYGHSAERMFCEHGLIYAYCLGGHSYSTLCAHVAAIGWGVSDSHAPPSGPLSVRPRSPVHRDCFSMGSVTSRPGVRRSRACSSWPARQPVS